MARGHQLDESVEHFQSFLEIIPRLSMVRLRNTTLKHSTTVLPHERSLPSSTNLVLDTISTVLAPTARFVLVRQPCVAVFTRRQSLYFGRQGESRSCTSCSKPSWCRCCQLQRISAEDLAPGGDVGRLTVFTKDAVEALN